jgi:hypothetical protein
MTRNNGLPIYRGTSEMEDKKKQAWHRKLAAALTVEEARQLQENSIR